MELQSSQRCLCPSAAGAQSQVGWLQPHGLGAPSLPDLKLQHPKLSLEGKGLATACEAPWAPSSALCPDTTVSTRPPGVWGHRMDTRV